MYREQKTSRNSRLVSGVLTGPLANRDNSTSCLRRKFAPLLGVGLLYSCTFPYSVPLSAALAAGGQVAWAVLRVENGSPMYFWRRLQRHYQKNIPEKAG